MLCCHLSSYQTALQRFAFCSQVFQFIRIVKLVKREIINIFLDSVVFSVQMMYGCEQILHTSEETLACDDSIRLMACYLDQFVVGLLFLFQFILLFQHSCNLVRACRDFCHSGHMKSYQLTPAATVVVA
jgi:hypothetical protein